MISYQWDSKARVKKLREKLGKEGYNVWIDEEQMSNYFFFILHLLFRNWLAIFYCAKLEIL